MNPIRARLQRAYTLIELMTVMAITAILLTIIVYPVFQAFGFTRQAQTFSDAQFRAKEIADQIASEVGDNAGVRDASSNHATFQIDVKSASGSTSFSPTTQVATNSLVISVPGQVDTLRTSWPTGWANSQATPATLANAELDIFKAAQDGSVGPSGGYVNPQTGKEDPTLTEPKGQVQLPVAPGRTLIRYAVTLRDPTLPYNNMYDGVLMKPVGGRDNLYVLRRFEVPTYIVDQTTDPVTHVVVSHSVPNKMAFIDLSRLTATHLQRLRIASTSGPLYEDPFFMDPNHSLEGLNTSGVMEWDDASKPIIAYDTTDPYSTVPDPTKAQMMEYWLRHSTVVTQLSRFDMLQAEYDRGSKKVVYDGNTPRVFPLIQFKPARVSSEPAVGQVAVRNGQESDNAGAIGPETFRTQKGYWSNPTVRLYPQGWQSSLCPSSVMSSDPNDLTDRYTIAKPDPTGSRSGLSIYSYNPLTDGCPEATSGTEVMDLGVYSQGGSYPFTAAISAANSRSGWESGSFYSNILASFEGFAIYTAQGYVRASFDISEIGNASATPTVPGNWPSSTVTDTYTPTTDPAPLSYAFSNYSGATYDINGCFNHVWVGDAYLGSGSPATTSAFRPDIHRFLNLRVTPQSDGTPSPMDPNVGFAHANIVPGSEEIYGPDENPGPNYGNQVRYYRVTQNPGPNQYRINYTDQPLPDLTVFGYSSQTLNDTTDPIRFGRDVLMPRYQRGYVQFDSDPNTPLPAGTITVRYRFQFTMPGDVVAVDYDTREVMSVLVTVKGFPQSSLSQPQTVTVPATAKVRYVLK